jgi:hypothetical protein
VSFRLSSKKFRDFFLDSKINFAGELNFLIFFPNNSSFGRVNFSAIYLKLQHATLPPLKSLMEFLDRFLEKIF